MFLPELKAQTNPNRIPSEFNIWNQFGQPAPLLSTEVGEARGGCWLNEKPAGPYFSLTPTEESPGQGMTKVSFVPLGVIIPVTLLGLLLC